MRILEHVKPNFDWHRPSLRFIAQLSMAFLVGVFMLAKPATPVLADPPSFAIGVSVSFGPPPIPYYVQPPCPGPRYMWTPGYWAWDPAYGYYWVPGTWVPAPFVGALWTPGYWGWDADGDDYVWYPGYWGTSVGFYGGIDYGFGYTGYGYEGGYWRGRDFYYNREANNVNGRDVRHIYSRPVEHRNDRISYNGGRGGIDARPTPEQMAASRQRRMGEVSGQIRQKDAARRMPRERASVNRGRPEIAATRRPGDFGNNAVHATRAGGHYVEPPISRAHSHPVQIQRTNTSKPGFHHFGQPNAQPRTQQSQRGNTHAERPGFHRFSQPPAHQRVQGERRAPQPRRPRVQNSRRQQQPRFQQRQAPRENHSVRGRQQAPPPRYQQRSAPRRQNAPRERGSKGGNNGHGHGRGNTGGGHRH